MSTVQMTSLFKIDIITSQLAFQQNFIKDSIGKVDAQISSYDL
jgi:hypothetical protein